MVSHDSFKASFSTEDRYRLLVESVTDYAIYMLDTDGFIVSWNAGAQRLKGYTEAEIIGRHFSTFYPQDDVRVGMPRRTLRIAAQEGRFEAEGWRVRKDGQRFWAHVVVDPIRTAAGELLGYAKVTRDLSERRFAEESLRQSEEQFRLLVQGVTDYAIYMLDPEGIVTNWNVGAERIKGYAPAEVIGTHFSRFYREEDRSKGEPARALVTAAREGRFESEGWRVRKDGSHFRANAVIDPIRSAAGDIIGFAKITRDVTEKYRAEEELSRARESLFQSQKLDAIGQLTGGVAHDFNNLLMVILSSLELVKRRSHEDPKSVKLVENAMQAARRGVSLTQRMLAFARRQELNPVSVDVANLVREMGDMLQRTLGSTIRIDVDLPDALPPVLVDPNQLELALLNLSVNARDAMSEGGSLSVSAREEQVAGRPDLSAGDYVCIAVTDSGSGMDEATLARATEPFFTTKGAGKGTGLGLPMVHGLAVQSGGAFVLKSAPGQGTTAEIWLPRSMHAAAQPAAEERRAAEATPAAAVLVVDDDALVLASTAAMLEDMGHSVFVAPSASEGLAVLDAQPQISLVITDQVMPGISGAALVARLKAERPGLGLILATGFGELDSDSDSGAIRLAKPYDRHDLEVAIGKARGRGPN